MRKSDVDFKKIPDAPGVYFFRGPMRTERGLTRKGEVLYVGKATSLRDRVKSYFSNDLAEVRSHLIAKVIADAKRVEWEETDSVLDALILEAKRIHELKPSGNTDLKDDKSWNWLVVTKEPFPRFLVVRERELAARFPKGSVAHLFGPFPRGGALKEALRIIRKIFPFFDTQFSVGGTLTKNQAKTFGFNTAIGLYPLLDRKAYARTVRYLTLLFGAKKKTLLTSLERQMRQAAKEERFEDAAEARRQLFALKHIQDVTLIKEELRLPESPEFRIEAYDTAHIGGSAPRGVMVVVVDGEARPSEYRVFTIRGAKAGDDYAALDEIIARRARHREWPFPKLVVIDGGRGHLARAKKSLSAAGIAADAVSVVKDDRHRPREILGPQAIASAHESAILLANAEAHRFSLARHRRAFRTEKRS